MPWPQQERVRNVFESATCFATVSGLGRDEILASHLGMSKISKGRKRRKVFQLRTAGAKVQSCESDWYVKKDHNYTHWRQTKIFHVSMTWPLCLFIMVLHWLIRHFSNSFNLEFRRPNYNGEELQKKRKCKEVNDFNMTGGAQKSFCFTLLWWALVREHERPCQT